MNITDASHMAYLVVTDYIPANSGEDVADRLQELIDSHPNRTLFFPDGEYLLGHPICTPAEPTKSVSLVLSNYATLRALPTWSDFEAMVRLGGKDAANTIRIPGSNYAFEGGIVDGSGVADGISVDSGRETAIRNVSIKNTHVGIHIKNGANYGSSDADISYVNIVGTGKPDSVGVLIEGWDNTVAHMRIANVFIGVDITTAGNQLRSIHPLYTSDYTDYENSCGFRDAGENNWYNNCYSDQFANGFRLVGDGVRILDNCFCYWYSPREGKHVAVRADNKFNAIVTNINIGYRGNEAENHILLVGEEGGNGILDRVLTDPAAVTGEGHRHYIFGGFLHK